MNSRPNSAKIRNLRISKGWSQEELARQARVGSSTVQRAERERAVRGSNLMSLAQALGVTVSDILIRPAPSSPFKPADSPSQPRLLGEYGRLLAATSDARSRIVHWRRGFADTFAYRSFFMRRHEVPLFAPLEGVAYLAATISLQLHRDVSEAIRILKMIQRQIEEVGVALRNHERTDHRLTPEAQEQVLNNGTYLCDASDLHLKRAEKELHHLLGLEGAG